MPKVCQLFGLCVLWVVVTPATQVYAPSCDLWASLAHSCVKSTTDIHPHSSRGQLCGRVVEPSCQPKSAPDPTFQA
jgi:hypothetical protein